MKRGTKRKLTEISNECKSQDIPIVAIAQNNKTTFAVLHGSGEEVARMFINVFAEDAKFWKVMRHCVEQFSEIPIEAIKDENETVEEFNERVKAIKTAIRKV